MAVAQTITIYKGESKTFRFTVTNDDDKTTQDLTGATIELQVKAKEGDADPALISKSVGQGIVILDQGVTATKGQFDVTFDPADTSNRDPKAYRYDVVTVIGGKRQYVVPPSEFRILPVVNGA